MAISKIIGSGLGTINSPVEFTSADNLTQLTLTSTDADANAGPKLKLRRNSASPADNDLIGALDWTSENSDGTEHEFLNLTARMRDVTAGSEDVAYAWTAYLNGTGREVQSFTNTDASVASMVFNEDSQDIDFRVESNGNANMLFVDGGSDHVNIGSNSDAGGVLNVSDGTSFSVGIVVENTGDTHGSVITFSNNSSSPADGDYIGGLIFKETNSAGGTHLYGKIFGIASDITDGTEDGALTFETSAAGANTVEHVRINSLGNLLLGVTSRIASSNAVLHINADAVATSAGSLISSCAATSEVYHVHFRNGNGGVGGINTSGSATAYVTSSDYRLKENVVTDWDATTRLKQLKPSRFNFKVDADTTVDGFLAHEVSSIVPEAIHGAKDATRTVSNGVFNSSGIIIAEGVEQDAWTAGKLATKDADGNDVAAIYPSNSTWSASKDVPEYQGIDQSKLVPLLVKTIQEALAEIDTLKTKVQALEDA